MIDCILIAIWLHACILSSFNLPREVQKRNYELEAIKYNMQGRKVREHPLQVEGEEGSAEGAVAFGSQQKNMFVLDAAKKKAVDEDNEDQPKKDDPTKKVSFITSNID